MRLQIGDTLTGDIVKDGHILYSNETVELEENQVHSTLGAQALEFFLYVGFRPKLKVSDKCRLVTKEGVLDVQVGRIFDLPTNIYAIQFVFTQPWDNSRKAKNPNK